VGDLVDRAARGVRAPAHDELTTALAAGLVADLDHEASLGRAQRGRFTRRAEGDDPARPVGEQASDEPSEPTGIDVVVLVEGGHDGHPEAAQIDRFGGGHRATMADTARNEHF
jgi:hypothetical protein